MPNEQYTFKIEQTVEVTASSYSEALSMLPEYHWNPFNTKLFLIKRTNKETSNA